MSLMQFKIATTEFFYVAKKEVLILAEDLSALYWNDQKLIQSAYDFLKRNGKIKVLHYGELDENSDMTALIKKTQCQCERLSMLNWVHSLIVDDQEYPQLQNFIVYDNKTFQYNQYFLSDKAVACVNGPEIAQRFSRWFHRALSDELALRDKLSPEEISKLRAESNKIIRDSYANMGRLITHHENNQVVKRRRPYGLDRTGR